MATPSFQRYGISIGREIWKKKQISNVPVCTVYKFKYSIYMVDAGGVKYCTQFCSLR